MMSTSPFAYSIQAANGSCSPTARGGVEQQSKETLVPTLCFVTPPTSKLISMNHSSTNLDFLRLKRHHSNRYESTASAPIAIGRTSIEGPALSNINSLQADASISAKVELKNVPKTKFILATPNQVSMEMQHPAVKRPRAVSMVRNDSTSADSPVHSNDEISPENRNGSISGTFLPIHDGGLEEGLSQEEGTMMTGKYGLKLKPKKRTVRGDLLFK
jgi:hypothetical protein